MGVIKHTSKTGIHYPNMPMQYIDEAVLTSTHNLCFRAKIRKNVYPCKPQFYFIKVGCKGVYITRTCYPDERYSSVENM